MAVHVSAKQILERLDALEMENRVLHTALRRRTMVLSWSLASVAVFALLLFAVHDFSVRVLRADLAAIAKLPSGLSTSKALIADVVAAQSFVIRDSEGRSRGGMGCLPGQVPSFTLLDANGNKPLQIMVSPDGNPIIALLDEVGATRIVMTAKSSSSGFSLLNNGHVRAKFAVAGKEGRPFLDFSDEEESTRLQIDGGDEPGLAVYDKSGGQRIGLGENGGSPMLIMNAKDSRARMQMGVLGGKSEPSFFDVFDKEEQVHRLLGEDGLPSR